MIFNIPGHIEMIRNGLPSPKNHYIVSRTHYPTLVIKTQTRRLNRGIYQVGKDYAVQRKRGVKAEPDIRIVMDRIWVEEAEEFIDACEVVISKQDAWSEGGYTPTEFEELFANLNPQWTGWSRWMFGFHVIEVRK